MTGVPKPPPNPNSTLGDAASTRRRDKGAKIGMQICQCVEVSEEDGENIENCLCTRMSPIRDKYNLPAQNGLKDIVTFL